MTGLSSDLRRIRKTLVGIFLPVIFIFLISTICFASNPVPSGMMTDLENTQEINPDGYDALAVRDLKNAYTASVAYHYFDNPADDVTKLILTKKGYEQTPGVNLEIIDGSFKRLRMKTIHTQGKYAYEIDALGNITERNK